MKPLAWIEIVDRYGDVAIRHPVCAYPVSVGRAYSCDVVLDDPYVAASHLEISKAEDGRFYLKDKASINGMTVDALRGRQLEATITMDNLVRIGHTQLRIRPADFPVAMEKQLPEGIWLRRWTALLLALPLLMLAFFTPLWAAYDHADSYNLLLHPMLTGLPFVIMWVIFWSIFSRKKAGSSSVIAHTVIACFGFGIFFLLDDPLADYIGFSLNSGTFASLFRFVVEPFVLGVMLYRHIRLVSRARARNVAMLVAGLTLVCTGIFYENVKLSGENDFTNMPYSHTVAPPSLILVQGQNFKSFISDVEMLKARVDE